METDVEKLLKVVAENLNLKDFKGDIVAYKHVETEIGNVESGGIAVQNVYYGSAGKEDETDQGEDADPGTEDDDFIKGVMPIFFNNRKEVLDFKRKLMGAKPKVITALVNDLLRKGKITSGGAKSDLWTLLHQYHYYRPSLSNWNMQVNV